MKKLIKYYLPAGLLLLLAFISGSQPNFLFAMLGFVSFFTMGVMLIIAGLKKGKNDDNESAPD